MTITPCRTCHLSQGCGVRLEKIRAVRGLKLTAIKFRCDLLKDSLQPGMKVQADLQYVCTGSLPEGDPCVEKRTVDAVVMAWSGEKVRIYVPYDDAGPWWLQSMREVNHKKCVHVLRVQPNQLHPSAERVSVCRHCGMPEDADVEGWSCGPDGDGCEFPEVPHAR